MHRVAGWEAVDRLRVWIGFILWSGRPSETTKQRRGEWGDDGEKVPVMFQRETTNGNEEMERRERRMFLLRDPNEEPLTNMRIERER